MFYQIEEDASTNLAGSVDLPGNSHDDEQRNIPEHGNKALKLLYIVSLCDNFCFC
jgi:hypothetical protein